MAVTKTTAAACNSRSKKRVRFEEDHETRQVKRRVLEIALPKSSLLTADEKTCYWMQPEDHRETLHDVMALMHDCHHKEHPYSNSSSSDSAHVDDPNKVPFAQYAEALALTFTLCDTPPLSNDDDDEDDEEPLWSIRDSQSVAQLALWASHHTPTRGVESKILPGLHQERMLRRTRAIQGVLEAQAQLRAVSVDEKMSSLSAVSQSLSHSAKQFATALAVVDGTQAYLEYTAKEEVAGCVLVKRPQPQGQCRKELGSINVPPTKRLIPESTTLLPPTRLPSTTSVSA